MHRSRRTQSNNMLFNFVGLLPLISLVLCFNYVESQSPSKITHISREQVEDVGGTVKLNCSVQNAAGNAVIWMKTDPSRSLAALPISSNTVLNVKNNRFSLNYDELSSTYTLQIKHIQETDAGIYQCQVIVDVEETISASVNLQVRRPPVIRGNFTKMMVVQEGQSIRLECYATGYPDPTVSWRRENNAILPIGGLVYRSNVLLIPEAHKADRGVYICSAENNVTSGATKSVIVEVEFAPIITIQRPRLGQSPQFDMDLVCRVEAYPLPSISWYKEGSQLMSNEHYSISQTAKATEYTESTIRVLSIEKQQYGRYQCKATNKLGTAIDYVELFETFIPNINYRGILWSSSAADHHLSYYLPLLTLAALLLRA